MASARSLRKVGRSRLMVLHPRKVLDNMTEDWKQTTENAEGILCDAWDLLQKCHEVLNKCGDVPEILCDAGDLFQECHEVLIKCGQVEFAEKVRKFCARVHQCMVSGEPWSNVKDVD